MQIIVEPLTFYLFTYFIYINKKVTVSSRIIVQLKTFWIFRLARPVCTWRVNTLQNIQRDKLSSLHIFITERSNYLYVCVDIDLHGHYLVLGDGGSEYLKIIIKITVYPGDGFKISFQIYNNYSLRLCEYYS
jgi:hypothetical protein